MYKGKYVSELSMSEVKEYYDELRENGPCTDEQWADYNILKERLIVFACKNLDVADFVGGLLNKGISIT